MEIDFGDSLFTKYATEQSRRDDRNCRIQIDEAFNKRGVADVTHVNFDVRKCGVGLVCPTNFGDRTPTLMANLKQCINEAQQEGGVPLKSVIVVTFDKDNKNYDNRKKVETLLRDAFNHGKIGYYNIVEAEPHSTARSLNVGVKATVMHDWNGNPPAYVIQVDDDSRYETGGLSAVALGAQERFLEEVSSITERPNPDISRKVLLISGAKAAEYSDDVFFPVLLKQYDPILLPYSVPALFMTKERGTDLCELMFWQGHNALIIDVPQEVIDLIEKLSQEHGSQFVDIGKYLPPLTPNENGRGFSFNEANLRVRQIGRAVPESRKGGEGPADYMTLPASVWPNHVGVVPVRLFDRNFVAGIETSNIMWGYGDRIRAMAIYEHGRTPNGLIIRDVIGGKVVNHYFADCPHSLSINFPSVLKKHCALWKTEAGRTAMSHYDDGSDILKPLPQHLIDSIDRAVFVTEKALKEYEKAKQLTKPEINVYGTVNAELYPCNSDAYTAQSSFLKIGGFVNRAICEIREAQGDDANITMDLVYDYLANSTLILDCYSA